MIISNSQLHEVLKAYSQSVAKTQKGTDQNKKEPVRGEKPVIQDRLSLSSQAQEVRRVMELARQAPEVRREKVEELKKEMAAGTYQVSDEEIADKIMARLVVDELL